MQIFHYWCTCRIFPILGPFPKIFIFSVTKIILKFVFYIQDAFRFILENFNIKIYNFLEPILEYVYIKIRKPLYYSAKNAPTPMADTAQVNFL